jgi:Na+-driven multidrug efflux pump
MGTGDMTQVFNYAKKLVKIMIIIGLTMSAILFIASGPLSSFFQVEPLVATYITNCIRVLAIVTVVKGLNMLIIVGILRSGGDTTFAMYLDGGAVWLVAVPLVFLGGFVWKLEIQYVYMLALTEEFVKVSIGLYRVWSKKWINNLIFEE